MGLEVIIFNLISRHCEGGYWDFKQQWHINNPELIKDIICLANNIEDNDAYLIFGIDDHFSIVGVENDAGRKNLASITQIINSAPFATFFPEIELKEIYLSGHNIDVLIIKNTNRVPYYLSRQYQHLLSGVIYSRRNDVNTGTGDATPADMQEKLWRKHFGLDINVIERLHLLLRDYENWGTYTNQGDWKQGGDFGNTKHLYHRFFPEFHIEKNEEGEPFIQDPIMCFYLSPITCLYGISIYYHSTLLCESSILAVDNYSKYIPFPKRAHFHNSLSGNQITGDGIIVFYYVCLDEIEGKMLRILGGGGLEAEIPYRTPEKWLLIFRNSDELSEFLVWARNNDEMFDSNITNVSNNPESEAKYGLPAWPTKDIKQAYHFYEKWREATSSNPS